MGRVIARPFVGAPGSLHAHGEPPRLRAAARRRDAARPAQAAAARRRHRQDRGPVRGPRDHAGASTPSATTTAWISWIEEMATVDRGFIFANLVDFDTLYGHRNDVEGYAREPRAVRRAARRRSCGALRRRPAGRHGRPRQRSDDAEHRPCARVRAAARDRARASARGADLGTRGTFADLGQTLAEQLRRRSACRTARSFLGATIVR